MQNDRKKNTDDSTAKATIVALVGKLCNRRSIAVFDSAFCLLLFCLPSASVKQRKISSPVAGSRNSLAASSETQPSACFTAVQTHSGVHQRRFADGFAAGDVFRVVVVGEQLAIEDRRHVGDGGNFVRRRRMREQFAALVVNQALAGHPAHALDEAADDLPHVDAGIDRAADVHQQIDARHGQLAGEAIDLHFGGGRALREIEKRIAAAGFAVVIDARRGVKAAGPEIDPLAPGGRSRIRQMSIRCCGIASVEH